MKFALVLLLAMVLSEGFVLAMESPTEEEENNIESSSEGFVIDCKEKKIGKILKEAVGRYKDDLGSLAGWAEHHVAASYKGYWVVTATDLKDVCHNEYRASSPRVFEKSSFCAVLVNDRYHVEAVKVDVY